LYESKILSRELSISILYNYRISTTHSDPEVARYISIAIKEAPRKSSSYLLRRIINRAKSLVTIRSLNLSLPIAAELEINVFSKEFILNSFKLGAISLPITIFIDEFGVYRNMYRATTGIYTKLVGMNSR